MSPEQADPPALVQPENQSVTKPALFWKRRTTWVPYLVVLVFVLASLTGAYFYRPNLAPQSLNEPSPDASVLGSWYRSNTENIRFVLPDGWTVSNNANLSLPVGFREPVFVLKKTGSTCVIVEAKQDIMPTGTLKQISFADRVFSNYHQYDGDWWIAATGDSAKYSFSDHTRQYIAGEFRISHSLRNDPFALFMSDGTAVPDDCNSDFNAMLKTVEPYYETAQLNSFSKGVLTTEKVWDDGMLHTAGDKSYEHLVFMADGSKEKREVMRIPTGTWAGNFSVFGNKLYTPANSYQPNTAEKKARFDSAICILDPFTSQTKQIPGTIATNAYISSLYLRDGVAYYLMGGSELGICLDGYNKCSADLYSIPLAGGEPTLVAHSSLGGMIIGYVESEGAFYIRQSWGDAGYSTTLINKIVGTREESVGEFDCCDGEGEADDATYKQMLDKINAITTKAGAMKILSEGVRINNGSLQPASNDISRDARFYFDK